MVAFDSYPCLQLPEQDTPHLREALWLCQASHGFYARAASRVESHAYSALFGECAELRRAMAVQLAALLAGGRARLTDLPSIKQPLVHWFEYSVLSDTSCSDGDGDRADAVAGMVKRSVTELLTTEVAVIRLLAATVRTVSDRVVRNRLSAQLASMQLLRDKLKRMEQQRFREALLNAQ